MTNRYIISSPLTNLLQLVNYTHKFKLHPIEKTQCFTIKDDKYTFTLTLLGECKLRPSVSNLINLILIKYTQNNKAKFNITIDEYMSFTGIDSRVRNLTETDKKLRDTDVTTFAQKDTKSRKKEAHKVLTNDIYTLSELHVKYNDKASNIDSRLFAKISKNRHGDVVGSIHPVFFEYLLKHKTIMIYPSSIAKTNSSRMCNPYLFALKNKINQLCKMNLYDVKKRTQKKTFNIGISTLLKVCYMNGMKTPEELYKKYLTSGKKAKAHYTRDILDVFSKTMEIIEEEENKYYSIEYLTSDKKSMYENEDAESYNFQKWKKGYIKIIFKDDFPRKDYIAPKNKHSRSKKANNMAEKKA